jgi:hypothetical protein
MRVMESDPTAMLRAWLGEWEKLANSVGGDALKSEEFARSLHGAGNATVTMQAALNQAMDRALAATNLPSRADIADLSARAGRIEASLARIEAALTGTAASPPGPKRTRKPPAA